MEFLRFTFQDVEHFFGVLILIGVGADGIAKIVGSLMGKGCGE